MGPPGTPLIRVASLPERVLAEGVVGKSPAELGPRLFSEKFCAVVLRETGNNGL